MESGLPVDWSRLGVDQQTYNDVVTVMCTLPNDQKTSVRVIKQQLDLQGGTQIDWGTIRLIVAHQTVQCKASNSVESLQLSEEEQPKTKRIKREDLILPALVDYAGAPLATSAKPAATVGKFVRHAGNRIVRMKEEQEAEAEEKKQVPTNQSQKQRFAQTQAPTETSSSCDSSSNTNESVLSKENVLKLLRTRTEQGGCSLVGLLAVFNTYSAAQVEQLLHSMLDEFLIYILQDKYLPL